MDKINIYHHYVVYTLTLTPMYMARVYNDDMYWYFSYVLFAVLLLALVALTSLFPRKKIYQRIAGIIMVLGSTVALPGLVEMVRTSFPHQLPCAIWLLLTLYFLVGGVLLLFQRRNPKRVHEQ